MSGKCYTLRLLQKECFSASAKKGKHLVFSSDSNGSEKNQITNVKSEIYIKVTGIYKL